MNENVTSQNTSQALAQQITSHIQELAEATDVARFSDEMARYMDTYSRFHNYSVFNTWSILFNRPDATIVAGFQKWRSLNRFVKKGEKGIPILAPMLFKENPDNANSKTILKGFRVVYVFAFEQTDGEPLPEPPNWKSPEQNLILFNKLVTFAESRGISVALKVLGGETQGVSMGGSIAVDPSAGTKTLIHEISHEILHRSGDIPMDSRIRELEAESVAFCVAKHFGLPSAGSPNYIALHGASADLIMKHLERIRKTATEIITTLER